MTASRGFKTVALTGGTGFVGRRLIDALLDAGLGVHALARDPKRLGDAAERAGGRLSIVAGSLSDEGALDALAEGADLFLNVAGATHALDRAAFARANIEGAAAAARAAAAQGAFFVHISSLAARMPALSDYAWSKFESEGATRAARGPDGWLALRLPAIFGPGDAATLPYFRMVKWGLAPEPMAATPARASILFVDDAVSAILTAAREAAPDAVYEVGDARPEGHTWREIGAALGAAFGKTPVAAPVPRAALALQAGAAEIIARMRGAPTFVTRGKVREFFHPDWAARDNLLSENTSWRPETGLEEGFAKTRLWYQEQGLI